MTVDTREPSIAPRRMRAVLSRLEQTLHRLDVGPATAAVGRIDRAGDGVARAVGLESPVAGELVDIEGTLARVESIHDGACQLVILAGHRDVVADATVRRTRKVLSAPVGSGVVGRVLDALGRPIDGRGPLLSHRSIPVESVPTPLWDREPVSRPLRTGILVVDAMVPVGRGQRQLVIGDRGTGKTSLCLDILAGLERDVVGVYVGIGRRGTETANHLAWLRRAGMFERGFAVIADADDPIGLVHLAPYMATAIAEDLALSGRDVAIVYDDLTTHANAHRTLALLLQRPVAREAFPADIFYAHARFLERATQVSKARGGGSLTAFPIVETQGGDLTSYIPTNLVSITDGQIRLDAGLSVSGQFPAVDVGLSVSRVGGKAQPVALRKAASSLKNRYAQFLELETFTRFGTRLEAEARAVVQWGRAARQVLRQTRGQSLSWAEITARATVLATDALQDLSHPQIDRALERCLAAMAAADPMAWAGLEQAVDVESARLERMWMVGQGALRLADDP